MRGRQTLEDGDLQNPFKEVLRSPFTRRIIEFLASKHMILANLKVYDGSTDPDDHLSRFVGAANQDETSYISDVPEIIQISAFMTNAKSSELSRRFLSQVPQTVTKMMKRVDDFIKLEEVFRGTELTKGEGPDQGQKLGHRHDRPYFRLYGGDRTRHNHPTHKGNVYNPYVAPRLDSSKQEMMRYEPSRGGLESLLKFLKETLATEPQLHFPQSPPTIGTPAKENMDRYCEYHYEKGHLMDDCYQLRRQLEMALESDKLNHLIKDVKQKGNNREV
ncbi:hypothetical protein Tco_0671987 [Tanacetum coccineum]